VTFTSTTDNDLSNDCPMPSANGAENMIALMWDDLDPGDNGDEIFYQSFGAGTCPYAAYAGACFVIQYDDFSHFASPPVNGDAGTWQAILQDDGVFTIQFQDVGVEAGSGSTTGIEDSTGTIGLTYLCDTAGLTNGLAIRFETQPQADLAVTKTALVDPVLPGNNATFIIDLVNNGPAGATGVVVTDVLSPDVSYVSDTCGGAALGQNWTWNVGALANGASLQCSLVVSVDQCAAIPNTASATTNEPDPPGNSSSSITLNQSFNPVQDGSFEAGTPNPFWNESSTNFGTPLCDAGGCGTGGGTAGPRTGLWWAWFGGATSNETAIADQNVVLSGTPELSFYLWAPTPSAGTASGTFDVYIDAASVFQINQGDPTYSGGYVLVQIDLTPYADGGTHNLRLEGIQVGADVVTFNVDDVAIAACGTGATVDLATVKSGVDNGDGTGTYTVVVTNNGPDAATAVSVSDPLPAGVSYTGDSCGGSAVGNNWTWVIGNMLAGAQVSCDITVSITNPADTVNVATVSSADVDSDPTNNSGTGILAQQQAPGIPELGTFGALMLGLVIAMGALYVLRRRS
jgi:uncharacterized repeat protein (TIGR01451 family)